MADVYYISIGERLRHMDDRHDFMKFHDWVVLQLIDGRDEVDQWRADPRKGFRGYHEKGVWQRMPGANLIQILDTIPGEQLAILHLPRWPLQRGDEGKARLTYTENGNTKNGLFYVTDIQ